VRELIILCLLTTASTSCLAESEFNHCTPSNIKAQVFITKKKGKDIYEEEVWTNLPKEISIHSGEYRNLQFKGGEILTLRFKDHKGIKTLSKKLTQNHIAKIDFTSWFDEVYTYKGGTLFIELSDKNKKKLCTHKMEVTGGD
jgi:hypothetical protein